MKYLKTLERAEAKKESEDTGASGDLQWADWKKAEEVTGLGTAERSCGQPVVANPVGRWCKHGCSGARMAPGVRCARSVQR